VAGIDLGGDGINMYPDLTKGVIDAMGQECERIHSSFDKKIGEIAALDSQLGKGPLGQNAEKQYNPFVDHVRGEMDKLKPSLEGKVQTGLQIVDRYIEMDQQSKQNIDNIR